MMHRDESNEFDIALQNLQTGAVQLLAKSGINESPSISPNGRMVLYASSDGRRSMLGIVSIDGRIRLQLPNRGGDVQSPAWSPFLL